MPNAQQCVLRNELQPPHSPPNHPPSYRLIFGVNIRYDQDSVVKLFRYKEGSPKDGYFPNPRISDEVLYESVGKDLALYTLVCGRGEPGLF